MNNTTDSFTYYLEGLVNKKSPMPSGSFDYRGYTITPVINDNPYLFHTWDACSANSPKRRVGKIVYLVTLKGYADETYFKTIAGAKKFIRNCNNR